jgi:hypothetical protein
MIMRVLNCKALVLATLAFTLNHVNVKGQVAQTRIRCKTRFDVVDVQPEPTLIQGKQSSEQGYANNLDDCWLINPGDAELQTVAGQPTSFFRLDFFEVEQCCDFFSIWKVPEQIETVADFANSSATLLFDSSVEETNRPKEFVALRGERLLISLISDGFQNGFGFTGVGFVPFCFNEVADGDETDLNCGGKTCQNRCGFSKKCLRTSDCESGLTCAFVDPTEPTGRCSNVDLEEEVLVPSDPNGEPTNECVPNGLGLNNPEESYGYYDGSGRSGECPEEELCVEIVEKSPTFAPTVFNPERPLPEFPDETSPDFPGETSPEIPSETNPEFPSETNPEFPSETNPEFPSETNPEFPSETITRFACVPKQRISSQVQTAEIEEALVYEAPAVVTTVAAAATLGTASAIGASVSFGQVLDFAQFAAVGGMMVAPEMPEEYVNFSSTFFWANLAVIPMGDVSALEARNALPTAGRRLQGSTANGPQGMERFALTVGTEPKFLLLSALVFVLCVCIVYLVGAIWVLKWDRSYAAEACLVRSVYYTVYPLSIFTSYAWFLILAEEDPLVSGSTGAKVLQAFLALFVMLFFWFWFRRCRDASSQAMNEVSLIKSPYKVILIDWKEEFRWFWIPRFVQMTIRGLFIGALANPTPIQGCMFLVTALLYFGALVYFRPYNSEVTNNVGIVVAFLFVINSILPIVFSVSPVPYTTATGRTLATVQIALNMISMFGLLLVVLVQMYARRQVKKRAKELAEGEKKDESPSSSGSDPVNVVVLEDDAANGAQSFVLAEDVVCELESQDELQKQFEKQEADLDAPPVSTAMIV